MSDRRFLRLSEADAAVGERGKDDEGVSSAVLVSSFPSSLEACVGEESVSDFIFKQSTSLILLGSMERWLCK